MLKVFAFSTRARPRVSQCCAAHLISGNGCSGNEGRPKTLSHRPHASSSQLEPKAAAVNAADGTNQHVRAFPGARKDLLERRRFGGTGVVRKNLRRLKPRAVPTSIRDVNRRGCPSL